MLVYLVIDLSLLRGSSREENLGKLVASVTRTLLSDGDDATQFGFSLTDSHVGGYMLSYQLNMVAQGMGIPKNVATTSACDLTRDDLINFLTLVKLVTDKNVVEELKLRTSRNSRSSDIPAVETCKVLHTVLKTSCVHKLQESLVGNSSSHSEGSQERSRCGYLLIMTPSLGSKDVLHGYVGKETLEACEGDVGRAFLKHLPLSLWKAMGSHRLSCAWMSGNSMEDLELLSGIEKEVQRVCPRFALTSLDMASAAGATMESFAACTGFRRTACQEMQEASSRGEGVAASCVDLATLWEETAPHSSIELLQMAMAKMMPRAANMTPLGRKTRRNGVRMEMKAGDVKHSVLSKAVGGTSKRTRRGAAAAGVAGSAMQSRRGQKAIRRARMPDHPKMVGAGAKCGNETPTSTVDQNANVNVHGTAGDGSAKGGLVPYVENLDPCTVKEASRRVQAAVSLIQMQVLEKTASASKDDCISVGLDTVPLLTAIVQKAMAEAAQYAHNKGESFDAASCRKVFVETACTPVEDLRQQHRKMPFESFQVLAWTCAVQLLLRLCIATTSCSWQDKDRISQRDAGSLPSVSLPPDGFAAVENIMHIIVATMSPIPSQGHKLFLKVVKPCFISRIKDDIASLEKSIWDEEEMVVDGDGGLAEVRMAAESLEESGETPDMSMDESNEANERKKPAVSKKIKAIKSGKHAPTHTSSAATGQLTPAVSADGSGIHGGGNYGGTAASGRRGELSSSNLLSRRFNNSKQYKMVVRANPGKSKMAPAAKHSRAPTANPSTRAKEHSKMTFKPSKPARSAKSAQTSDLDASKAKQAHADGQIPDTPLGKAPGQTVAADDANKNRLDGAGDGMTTPDTALMKRGEDVIPNTSPREQPATKPNQMKRIGSIRQPMFDDQTADAIFKPSNKADGPAKNTWLSGAIVKRRRPAPSGATRMGDMQNVDSTTLARQETEIDIHKEIMSPLKPRPQVNGNSKPDLSSVRTRSEEVVDDIEVVLSPGPFVRNEDDNDDTYGGDCEAPGGSDAPDAGGARDHNHHCGDGQPEDHGADQCNERGNEGHQARDSDVEMEEDGGIETSETLNTAVSDDEDSMAAKNDGGVSECSSSHLHGQINEDDITSPGDKGRERTNTGPHHDKMLIRSPFDSSVPDRPRAEGDAEGGDKGAEESTPTKKGTRTNVKRRTVRGGRLARMHGRNTSRADPNTTPTSQANHNRSRTPTRSPIAIEDRGSPCKPSPGYDSFSSPPRHSDSPGPDYASDTDSSFGDSPDVMIAMKPLMQPARDKYDSEEEDAAILNAAANGDLSPVDSDKPAPVPRRTRKKGLVAVATRGPTEIARRNKMISKGKAATNIAAKEAGETTEMATTPANPQAHQTQKKLTAPLGQKKRAKVKSVDAILADLDDFPEASKCDKREKQGANEPGITLTTSNKPGKGKMTRMPEEGDVVVCFIKSIDSFVRSAIVKEGDVALARRGKGWCLTADVVPVGSCANLEDVNAGPFTVKLDSTKEISPQESFVNDASWYRVDPCSPGGPTIVHKTVGATEMHNKAVRAKAKEHMPRQESTPVLRPIENVVPVTVSNPRKRRKLQPTNLRYEGKALASAEKIRLHRPAQDSLMRDVGEKPVDSRQYMQATQLFAENTIPGTSPRTSPGAQDRSLNFEAKSVIARAKALLADPNFV